MYVCMYVHGSCIHPVIYFIPISHLSGTGIWWRGQGLESWRGAGMKGAAGITATSRSAAVAARSGLFSLFTALGKTSW